jgi:hypothetical protein
MYPQVIYSSVSVERIVHLDRYCIMQLQKLEMNYVWTPQYSPTAADRRTHDTMTGSGICSTSWGLQTTI